MPTPKIGFEISSVEAKRGASQIRSELKAIQSSVRAVVTDLDKMKRAFSTISVSASGKGGKGTTGGFAESFKQQSQQLKTFQATISKELKTQEKNVTASLNKQSQSFKRFATDVEKALKRVEVAIQQTSTAIKVLQPSSQQTAASVKVLTKELDQISTKAAGVKSSTQGVGQGIAEVGKKSQQSKKETEDFNRSLSELSKVAQIALGPLSGVASRITAFSTLTSLTSVGLAGIISGFIGAGGVVVAAFKASQALDELKDRADELTISGEKLQELRFIGERSGVNVQLMERSIEALSRRIGQAVDAAGQGGRALEILGLKAENLVTLPVDQQLRVIADEFVKLEDGSIRSAVAADLFSRAGLRMINVLAQGSKGIDALALEARKLGGVISQHTIVQAAQLHDRIDSLKLSLKATAQNVLSSFLPAFIRLATHVEKASMAMAAFFEQRREFSKRTNPEPLNQEIESLEALISAYQRLAKARAEGKSTLFRVQVPIQPSEFVGKALSRELAAGGDPVQLLTKLLAEAKKRQAELNGEIVSFGDIAPEAYNAVRDSARDFIEAQVDLFESIKNTKLELAALQLGGPGLQNTVKAMNEVRESVNALSAIEVSQLVISLRNTGQLSSTELAKLNKSFDESGRAIKQNVLLTNDVLAAPLPNHYEVLVEVLGSARSRLINLDDAQTKYNQTVEDSANRVDNLTDSFTDLIRQQEGATRLLNAFRAGGESAVLSEEARLQAEDIVGQLQPGDFGAARLRLQQEGFLTDESLKELLDLNDALKLSFRELAAVATQVFQETGTITKETLIEALTEVIKETKLSEEALDDLRDAEKKHLEEVERKNKEITEGIEKFASSLDEQMQDTKDAIRLVGLEGKERAQLTAILKLENEARQINKKLGEEVIVITDEQRNQVRQLTGDLFDLNEAEKQRDKIREESIRKAEDFAKELQRPLDDFAQHLETSIRDAIVEGLDKGEFEFKKFFKDLKRAFIELAVDEVITNVKVNIQTGVLSVASGGGAPVSASGGGGIAGAFGGLLQQQQTSQAVAQGVQQGLSPLQTSIGNFFARLFNQPQIFGTPGGAIGPAPAPGSQPASFANFAGSVASIPVIGSIIGGTLSGRSLINALNLRSQDRNKLENVAYQVGSILGGIAGGLVGAWAGGGGFGAGGFGGAAGGAGGAGGFGGAGGGVAGGAGIGSFLGSFIIGSAAVGQAQVIRQLGGKGDTGGIFEADNRLQAINRGAQIGGPIGAIIGGLLYNKVNRNVGVTTAATLEELLGRGLEGGQAVFRQTPFGFVGALGSQTGGDVGAKGIANTLDTVRAIDRSLAEFLNRREEEIVKTFISSSARGIGFSNPKRGAEKLVGQRISQVVEALGIPAETIAGLGLTVGAPEEQLNKATALLQQRRDIIDVLAEIQGTAESITSAQKAIENMQELVDTIGLVGPTLGVVVDDLQALEAQGLAKLTEGFDKSIRDLVLAITDPAFLAMENLTKVQELRLREARDFGADIVEVERLALLERQELLKQLNQPIQSVIDNILFTVSGQAPLAALQAAQERFNELTTSGVIGDRSAIATAAQTLLGLGESLLGGPAFAASRDEILSVLQGLLVTFPTETAATSEALTNLILETVRGNSANEVLLQQLVDGDEATRNELSILRGQLERLLTS